MNIIILKVFVIKLGFRGEIGFYISVIENREMFQKILLYNVQDYWVYRFMSKYYLSSVLKLRQINSDICCYGFIFLKLSFLLNYWIFVMMSQYFWNFCLLFVLLQDLLSEYRIWENERRFENIIKINKKEWGWRYKR